ncbi:uncharacterized protein LOC116349543 [Contarinia nasturtii]|uniref:uncharacterized protein LOC116349543 n=1 Tax=Contarinia nasturtii TaxID=265458 RepID=UPI0012D3730C|nr:uncharacterized protein LOC116349543 [Contarinia nasturtii]
MERYFALLIIGCFVPNIFSAPRIKENITNAVKRVNMAAELGANLMLECPEVPFETKLAVSLGKAAVYGASKFQKTGCLKDATKMVVGTLCIDGIASIDSANAAIDSIALEHPRSEASLDNIIHEITKGKTKKSAKRNKLRNVPLEGIIIDDGRDKDTTLRQIKIE